MKSNTSRLRKHLKKEWKANPNNNVSWKDLSLEYKLLFAWVMGWDSGCRCALKHMREDKGDNNEA